MSSAIKLNFNNDNISYLYNKHKSATGILSTTNYYTINMSFFISCDDKKYIFRIYNLSSRETVKTTREKRGSTAAMEILA